MLVPRVEPITIKLKSPIKKRKILLWNGNQMLIMVCHTQKCKRSLCRGILTCSSLVKEGYKKNRAAELGRAGTVSAKVWGILISETWVSEYQFTSNFWNLWCFFSYGSPCLAFQPISSISMVTKHRLWRKISIMLFLRSLLATLANLKRCAITPISRHNLPIFTYCALSDRLRVC